MFQKTLHFTNLEDTLSFVSRNLSFYLLCHESRLFFSNSNNYWFAPHLVELPFTLKESYTSYTWHLKNLGWLRHWTMTRPGRGCKKPRHDCAKPICSAFTVSAERNSYSRAKNPASWFFKNEKKRQQLCLPIIYSARRAINKRRAPRQ